MRALLSHSLQFVVGAALLVGLGLGFTGLPQPIGQLSDYGAVLDRHGRERIEDAIAEAEARYGLKIYILASWENPLSGIDTFTRAVFDDWNLTREAAILTVFLKEGRNWDVRVLASDRVHAAYGDLASFLEAGIEDLVDHRRVEEAMIELFAQLGRRLGGGVDPVDESPTARGLPPAVVITLLFAVVLALAAFIHFRVCPRCGRLLRAEERPASGRSDSGHRVYSCRRCGHRKS